MKRSLNHLAFSLVLGSALLFSVSGWAQGFGGGFGGGAGRRTTTTSYPASTSAGQALFMPDPETRKVIAITDADTARNISMVVSNLDRPAPQVLIKVVFLEATYTHNLDLGIEGSFTKNMGNSMTGIVDHSFGLKELGTTPVPPGAGIYQILGSDFQATLRAIAQAGKTEILSRPSVLARNNQQATIQLAQQVPLVSNTRFDTLGNQINTVQYRNVGIILTVTPFITSDGMVEMVVSPQVSQLAAKEPVGAHLQRPGAADPLTGDQLTLGGHGGDCPRRSNGCYWRVDEKASISKPTARSRSWVTFPAWATCSSARSAQRFKTELLIFLTPRIVMHPSQLAGLSGSDERSKLSRWPSPSPSRNSSRFLRQEATCEHQRR